MRRHHHVLDIYGTHLHLASQPRELRRLIKKYSLDGHDPKHGGATTFVLELEAHRHHVVIWIRVDHGDALEVVETAAHEAAHAAGMILGHLGQEYDGESEAHAYLVGWITRWIIEQIPWKR